MNETNVIAIAQISLCVYTALLVPRFFFFLHSRQHSIPHSLKHSHSLSAKNKTKKITKKKIQRHSRLFTYFLLSLLCSSFIHCGCIQRVHTPASAYLRFVGILIFPSFVKQNTTSTNIYSSSCHMPNFLKYNCTSTWIFHAINWSFGSPTHHTTRGHPIPLLFFIHVSLRFVLFFLPLVLCRSFSINPFSQQQPVRHRHYNVQAPARSTSSSTGKDQFESGEWQKSPEFDTVGSSSSSRAEWWEMVGREGNRKGTPSKELRGKVHSTQFNVCTLHGTKRQMAPSSFYYIYLRVDGRVCLEHTTPLTALHLIAF